MQNRKGKLHLIIGPMYSGKTTSLIRLKNRATIAGKKCLVIKYHKDDRYDDQRLATHDMITEDAVKSVGNNLANTISTVEDLDTYQVILIDEVQFYTDGADTCDQLASLGYEVIVCGLQGDFKREPFGCIPRLVSKADIIEHITAIDAETGEEAPFTARITDDTEQEVIGGKDKYIAVCRSRHDQILQSIG